VVNLFAGFADLALLFAERGRREAGDAASTESGWGR
jgi:hypothetical protein